MTEHLSEKEVPSLEKGEDVDPSDMIKVTIDEENEEDSSLEHGSSAVNQIEKNANSSQIMHDHNYGSCAVSLNTGASYFGSNGKPFPILEGLMYTQNKLPLPQKGAHPEIHNTTARTIRTSVGAAPINFFDTKSREELLKRRSVGNIITRPRDDVFVLSGRAFDNNRLIEQKKLQRTTMASKFPLRSTIKPTGVTQGSISLSRQFGSPNSGSASTDQLNPNIAFYQQRQTHRPQQPIILKATPRILQPVSATYRRQPIQRPSVQTRKQATDEESAILDVVNEEELRNQKFFQKQIGNQQQQNAQAQRQVTTSVSADESNDPHGYFHKFQSVRHQPTNLIQSPPCQDFSRQSYAVPQKAFYQSPQQFSRVSQPGGQQFISPQESFPNQQQNSLSSQPSVRPRMRKPLIETTESPHRTPKIFTTPVSLPPKSSGRGRKKKGLSEKKSVKANASYNENIQYDEEEGDYITRCICGMKHNDPNMIACDMCDVWQHMACMGIDPTEKNKNANTEYNCEQCQPRPLKYSRDQAAAFQRKFLEAQKAARGRKSAAVKTPKPTRDRVRSTSDAQRRSSISVTPVGKPENKFVETKITRGVRKIIDKLSEGDASLYSKLGEPRVQTLVVAPQVYGVVSSSDIEAGDPIFEYKASLSLRDERGAQSLTSKFFGNLIHVVPGKGSDDGEIIFADASRHNDGFSSKLRKSCQPNAEIRHVITKDRDNEDLLRLFVVAKEQIENCTEITIPLDLEYRTEIIEIDCACRTVNYTNQPDRFADGCPVGEHIRKKENGVQQNHDVPSSKTVHKTQSPPSKQQKIERHRTASNQAPNNTTLPVTQSQEPKPEVSPPPAKTPTPLAEELEIASILTQDLPRSKSLTSSPTRHSPVKTTSSKKSGEKLVKKAVKTRKEPQNEFNKKPTTSRKADGMSREIASLFDDNKFLSSSLDFEEATPGRSLRQRGQIKKEDPEASSSPTISPKIVVGGHKRQASQTTATQPKPSKRRNEQPEMNPSVPTVGQIREALKATTFSLNRKILEASTKSKRYKS